MFLSGVLKTPFARSFAVHSCARLVGAAKHGLQALSQSAISCIRRRSCGSHLLRATAALYAGRAPELVEGAARRDRSRSQAGHRSAPRAHCTTSDTSGRLVPAEDRCGATPLLPTKGRRCNRSLRRDHMAYCFEGHMARNGTQGSLDLKTSDGRCF